MNKYVKQLLDIDIHNTQFKRSYINLNINRKNDLNIKNKLELKNKINKKILFKKKINYDTIELINLKKNKKKIFIPRKKEINIPFYNYSSNLNQLATRKKLEYNKSLKFLKTINKKCTIKFKFLNNVDRYKLKYKNKQLNKINNKFILNQNFKKKLNI